MAATSLGGATAALRAFAGALPPSTARDCLKVVTDLAVALKAELAGAIALGCPNIPLVRGVIVKAMIAVVGATIDNLVGQLSAKIGA
ncbi:MAG TPA: hypothetical protein VGI30_05250 [Caulobacteraceae bacterium]